MTRVPERPRARPTYFAAGAVLATLAILLLSGSLVGATPARVAGAAPYGPMPLITCPSTEGNHSGLYITTNGTNGAAPYPVQFCSFSPKSVSGSYWFFGDGTSSTQTNTTHTFSQPGNYTVMLNVSYTAGGAGSTMVVIHVTAGTYPVTAVEQATPSNGTAPLTVVATTELYNGSTPIAPGTSYEFAWSWTSTAGGPFYSQYPGTTSDSMNITLSQPGTWIIEGNATSSIGAVYSATISVVVEGSSNGTGNLTVAPFADPQTAPAPATVFFNATATGGDAPYLFTWTFGDGGNGTGQSQQHTYTQDGLYQAVVTVTDHLGDRAYGATQISVVGNQSPGNGSALNLSFTAAPTRGSAPLNVTFSLGASGGTAPYSLSLCITSSECWFSLTNWSGAGISTVGHYPSAGNYTATATLTDSAGAQTIGTIPIIVLLTPPLNVTWMASLLSGPAPWAVGFLASVSGGTAPYSIQWNWGDGTLSSSANGAIVAHAYTTVGVYSPTLTVSDSVGHNVTLSLGTVNVTSGTTTSTKGSGILPQGGPPQVVLEYLGIAVVGAIVSGVALGVYLRRRGRHQEGATLVTALETTAGQPSGPTHETEGER